MSEENRDSKHEEDSMQHIKLEDGGVSMTGTLVTPKEMGPCSYACKKLDSANSKNEFVIGF